MSELSDGGPRNDRETSVRPLGPGRLWATSLVLGVALPALDGALVLWVTRSHPTFRGTYVVDGWRLVWVGVIVGACIGALAALGTFLAARRATPDRAGAVGLALVAAGWGYLFTIGGLHAYASVEGPGAMGLAAGVALVGAFLLAGLEWGRPSLVRALGGVSAVLAVVGLVAFGVLLRGRDLVRFEADTLAGLDAQAASGPVPRSGTPDLLLVTVDTLRADHTGPYGYGAVETPGMDGLAAQGVVFTDMVANSSWTRSSFGSMMTARLPSEHGANWVMVDDDGDGFGTETTLFTNGLDPTLPTLAEELAKAGYRTAGINTNVQTAMAFGFERGFDVYMDYSRPVSLLGWGALCGGLNAHWDGSCDALTSVDDTFDYLPGPQVTATAERMLDGLVASEQPFFLWVHYMDPHVPYRPHRPGAERIDYSHMIAWLGGETADLPTVRATLTTAYDDEIGFVDASLSRLFARLTGPRLREAGVVFTSDHGEELVERWKPASERTGGRYWHNRGYGHGHTHYDEQLKVPLIVRFPDGRRAGERQGGVVQHVDLAPTLLAMAGQSFPDPRGVDVAGLLAAPEPGEGDAGRVAIAEANCYAPVLTSATTSDTKVLRTNPDQDASFWELYALSADPGETNPLPIPETPDQEGLLRSLDRWMEEAPDLDQGAPVTGEGVQEALEALGYIQ